MQICTKHWKMLREAVELRGLSQFIAGSGEEALQQVMDQFNEEPTDYDPLMACNWMITGRALEMGGLYLMTCDLCPVCEAVKHMSHIPVKPGDTEPAGEAWVEKHWIDGPADAVLGECVKRGMVKQQ